MNEFLLWFTTGLEHILDLNGYDHILYIVSLCALFSIKEWKQLLVLVTAFTIGHSFTLAMSVLNMISVQQGYIEMLIPITIMLTCLVNIIYTKPNWFKKSANNSSNMSFAKGYQINYSLALLFGFIHGMGFSYLLKSMLGKEESIVFPLFSFNLGLEFGQLIIVATVLLFSILFNRFSILQKPTWIVFVSLVVLVLSTYLLVDRISSF